MQTTIRSSHIMQPSTQLAGIPKCFSRKDLAIRKIFTSIGMYIFKSLLLSLKIRFPLPTLWAYRGLFGR